MRPRPGHSRPVNTSREDQPPSRHSEHSLAAGESEEMIFAWCSYYLERYILATNRSG